MAMVTEKQVQKAVYLHEFYNWASVTYKYIVNSKYVKKLVVEWHIKM